MMQHGTGHHQVKVPGSTGPARMSAWRTSSPGRPASTRDRSRSTAITWPAGRNPPGQPGGHRAVAAADFERPRSRPDVQPLDVAVVHGVEQPRHQLQPLPLAFQVMIKDLFGHSASLVGMARLVTPLSPGGIRIK